MAKDQALKLEILSAKHPDLLIAVNAMFDRFATPAQVQQMILKKYHETVHQACVRTYKQARWQVFKNAVTQQKVEIKAINEIIGEDGLGAAANALLWQEMQTMTVTEKINLKKVLNDDQKVALLKKRFVLTAREHRGKMAHRRPAVPEGGEAEGPSDPLEEYAKAQRVVEQVKEIFGIGMTAHVPPKPRFAEIGSAAEALGGPAEERSADLLCRSAALGNEEKRVADLLCRSAALGNEEKPQTLKGGSALPG